MSTTTNPLDQTILEIVRSDEDGSGMTPGSVMIHLEQAGHRPTRDRVVAALQRLHARGELRIEPSRGYLATPEPPDPSESEATHD